MTALTAWLDAYALGLWTVAVAILCNVSCAILGCYLVLRRMSLLGDAISHAVLPGLALAFLLTSSRSGWAMAIGAAVLGVLTAFLTNAVHRLANVPEDASMGLVFTSLFAVGVLLITRAAAQVDLDPGCVLYGSIEAAPEDTVPLFGLEVPRVVQTLGPALIITVAFVALLWKELKLVSFDPALAAAMGFRVALIHYLLMAMVAGVTVASFEAVGSILVIAMLIVPGATAHLLTDRLGRMIAWAVVVAVLSAVLGYLGAVWLDTNVAGMMAVAAGGLFGLAVLFAPRHGVLSKLIRRARLALRIAEEDVLAELYRAEESPAGRSLALPARSWLRWAAERLLYRTGRIEPSGTGGWRLTPRGRTEGRELVRSHRLWEAFLNARLELPADHVHDTAHRLEHFTDPALAERIATDLANPDRDPHGRPIPPPHD
jgi:manganese/zinc/iron transport system permease protein